MDDDGTEPEQAEHVEAALAGGYHCEYCERDRLPIESVRPVEGVGHRCRNARECWAARLSRPTVRRKA